MFRDIFNKAFYFLQMALIYFGYTDPHCAYGVPKSTSITAKNENEQVLAKCIISINRGKIINQQNISQVFQ